MSCRPYYTVWCDGITGDGTRGEDHADGCPQWSEASSAGRTARESRAAARRVNGWTRRRIDGHLRDLSQSCARAASGSTREDER